jgi:hypothetical protein
MSGRAPLMPGVMLLRVARRSPMRRISRILTGCLCLILYPALTCSAKEWHGIVPLHTTRAEVIKLLGTPKHTYTNLEHFDVADDEVMIYWIDPTCERPYASEEYEAQDDVRPGDLVLNECGSIEARRRVLNH